MEVQRVGFSSHEGLRPFCGLKTFCFLEQREKSYSTKNPWTYVTRLASTFFRVFRVFRGSYSSPYWVAGEARARFFVLLTVYFFAWREKL